MIVEIVVVAVWVMLPAYVPNSIAVIGGGGRPIDAGYNFRGERLLGDGKTWRGAIIGAMAGTLLAFLMNGFLPTLTGVGFEIKPFVPSVAFSLGFGSILGDIVASFLKRRTGREQGKPLPVVDQLDFVAGSLICTMVFSYDWAIEVFNFPIVLAVLIISPLLHLGANIVAYSLDLKDEPY